MSRRRHTPEQIITALREAEVGLANGKTVGIVSRELGISEQTYYRWRKEFGMRGLMAETWLRTCSPDTRLGYSTPLSGDRGGPCAPSHPGRPRASI